MTVQLVNNCHATIKTCVWPQDTHRKLSMVVNTWNSRAVEREISGPAGLTGSQQRLVGEGTLSQKKRTSAWGTVPKVVLHPPGACTTRVPSHTSVHIIPKCSLQLKRHRHAQENSRKRIVTSALFTFLYLRKLLKLRFSRLLHSPTLKKSVTELTSATYRNVLITLGTSSMI